MGLYQTSIIALEVDPTQNREGVLVLSPLEVPPPQACSFAYPTILLLQKILEVPKIFWEEIVHVREFLETRERGYSKR